MFSLIKKVAMLAILLTLSAGCMATSGIKLPTLAEIETAKEKVAGDIFLDGHYDQAPTQNRAGYRQMHPETTAMNITTVGDVIGDKGRIDGMSYKNGTLTVHEGWLRDGVTDFAPKAYQYTLGTQGFEFTLSGDFFGNGCDSILAYDTNGFKVSLWENRCLFSKTSKTKFVKRQPMVDAHLQPMISDFLRDFNGYYFVQTCDVDGEGKDDLVFTARAPNGVATVMVLYANHPRNRADNLEFGQSPLGYKVERQSLGKTGLYIRCGNVHGDAKAEIVVMNENSKNDMDTYVYSFVGGKFKKGKRERFDVPLQINKGTQKVLMFDADLDGHDNLVVIREVSGQTFMAYADFTK